MGEYFDELTKAVAKGVGRRQALVRLGTGLLGAAAASIGMASLGAPEAQAESKNCMDYCGTYTRLLRGQCLRVCNTCPGGRGQVCFNYESDTFSCCTSSQTCSGSGICQ